MLEKKNALRGCWKSAIRASLIRELTGRFFLNCVRILYQAFVQQSNTSQYRAYNLIGETNTQVKNEDNVVRGEGTAL